MVISWLAINFLEKRLINWVSPELKDTTEKSERVQTVIVLAAVGIVLSLMSVLIILFKFIF